MKLNIDGQIKEFTNDEAQITMLLQEINQALEQSNNELSHLIIDGVAVYQDFDAYLRKNIAVIEQIEVVTLELKPLIQETIASAFAYLNKAIVLLNPLANGFYQSPDPANWNQLADLFEGIAWLLDTMKRIDQIENLQLYISDYTIWNEYVMSLNGLNNLLKELEQAMVGKDQVLIGDLILYEILPVFETASEKLRFLIPTGGNHVS